MNESLYDHRKRIFNDLRGLIGNTPLVHIPQLSPREDVKVYAKLESYNPTGSHKDRIAFHILNHANETGKLEDVKTLVEASSGSTSSSVAFMAYHLGMGSVLFVPAQTSKEKMSLARSFGATVVPVSKDQPFEECTDYMQAKKKFVADNPSCFDLNQYKSPWNSDAHYRGLGREITDHFADTVDFFVTVGSTGGTISGVGKRLKEINSKVQIVLGDPVGSIYYPTYYNQTDYKLQKSAIQGAGKDSMPDAMNLLIVDRVERFTDREAFDMTQKIAKEFGLVIGGTAGANALIAQRIAHEQKSPATIVTIFPDSGFKYHSQFSNKDWQDNLNASYDI